MKRTFADNKPRTSEIIFRKMYLFVEQYFFEPISKKTALVNCQNSKQFDKMAPEHAHPKVYLFGKELYDKKYCLTELLVFK